MELVKISELAARSGVPIATLKHYVREGLIEHARKTGRTMCWYDAALASRVRAIKRMQHEQYLPLDLIRKAIDRNEVAPDDLAAAETIASVLASHGGKRSRTRAEVIARGVPEAELDWLERAGLAVPVGSDRRYTGDDLALLVTLGSARAAGITPEMLPFAILGEYLQALRALVDVELRMFRAGVLARAQPARVRPLTAAATRLSERLVVLLRRKLLLPTLDQVTKENAWRDHPSEQRSSRSRRAARTINGAAPGDGPSDAPATIVDAMSAPGGDAPLGSNDPANDGPFTVTTADVTIPAGSGRMAAATTYVPASAPSPRPLVFVSPGFQMSRTEYASYAQHLASWGMTVVLADYTDTSLFPDHQQLADDISVEITWALAQSSLAIDPGAIATAGHSLGGKLSVLVAVDDSRVKAVVGWDPVDGGSAPTVAPLMGSMAAKLAVVGETTDGSGGLMPCAPTADNYATFYAAAGLPALAMTLDGASHMNWVDDPSCALCSLCTAGTAPASLAHTTTRRLDVAWLRQELLGDATMAPWLSSPPEVLAGMASVQQK